MRIATYNVENLFDRARVMNLQTWSDGREVRNDFAALNRLLGKVTYTGGPGRLAHDRNGWQILANAASLKRSGRCLGASLVGRDERRAVRGGAPARGPGARGSHRPRPGRSPRP